MPGLLIDGNEVVVPGVDVYNWRDVTWCKLDGRDYRMRKTPWIRQGIIHSTQGKSPQRILPGRGPGGTARATVKYWAGDPQHSGAHFIVDNDETVACLADLEDHCTFHATTSNDWSYGVEMRQEPDGSIYECVLDTTVRLVKAVNELLGIPFQIASDPYVSGKIIERMKDGGRDCVGLFGHRDQSWVFPEWMDAEERKRFPNGRAGRGSGDPGDEIYKRFVLAGAEPLRFDAREDLVVWMRRQARLNTWGAKLAADGICGPATIAAMKKFGFAHGRDIDTAVEDPRNR